MRASQAFASRFVVVVLMLGLVLAPPARAEWSDDPAVNLSVADGAGDQILPKIAFGFNNTWIAWFGGIGAGYDVRAQLLSYQGSELFAHNGILVADRGFSSVQDWGIDQDEMGRGVLAFRDDRFAGTQITAALVSTSGTLLWGANGVQLTNTVDFVASPKVAATATGYVVAWTQNTSTRLQKLDGNGAPQWTNDIVLTPATGSYSVSDLHAHEDEVIVSFVHQTGGFGSPRHIVAQKFDADGNALWGAGHAAVFDGGSIQLGNFPPFVSDELGGAVFSWYSTSPLQCRVQRILANGTEAYAHDGVAVSTNATRIRVSPSACFDAATGNVYAFWEEQNSLQSQSGLYGQKIDAAGNRLTPEGVAIVALSSTQVTQVRTTVVPFDGAQVVWNASSGSGQDRLYGARMDANGVVDVAPFDIASTPSGKSRLVVGTAVWFGVPESTGGYSLLAWSDGRNDGGDVLVQPVRWDGYLGLPTGAPEIVPAATGLRLTVHPNPLRGSARIDWVAPADRDVALQVHDVSGRLVRSLPANASEGSIVWDGNDSSGTPVAAGVYFVRLNSEGIAQARTLTVVR